MAKSKTVRITPNLQKCIDELKEAVNTMPSGDSKKKAEGALNYLTLAFKGEKQPLRGRECPVDKAIIKS